MGGGICQGHWKGGCQGITFDESDICIPASSTTVSENSDENKGTTFDESDLCLPGIPSHERDIGLSIRDETGGQAEGEDNNINTEWDTFAMEIIESLLSL